MIRRRAYLKRRTRPRPMSAKMSREKRYEARQRVKTETRDGYCRFSLLGLCGFLGTCGGRSEYCHWDEKRRCHTRGMAPDDRHATGWTFMGCRDHHRAYDRHAFELVPQTPAGLDGPTDVCHRDGEVIGTV